MKKGDVYDWNGVRVEILRVAKDGSWADIRATSPGSYPFDPYTWIKRQPVPDGGLPPDWVLQGPEPAQEPIAGDSGIRTVGEAVGSLSGPLLDLHPVILAIDPETAKRLADDGV